MWIQRTTPEERKAILAAFAGYGADAFDFTMYTIFRGDLELVWGLESVLQAQQATLITSVIGGWLAGILADRFGKVRVLQWTIAWFALLTALCGCAQSAGQFVMLKGLQGLGVGGEWAVGAMLVSEAVNPEYRGKAVGITQAAWAVGWAAAALAYGAVHAWIGPELGWRVLCWLGLAPALLVLYVRREVREPSPPRGEARGRAPDQQPFWGIFGSDLWSTTLRASLLGIGMQSGYHVTLWAVPKFLGVTRKLSIPETTHWILVMCLGSLLGYLVGAHTSDRFGRRAGFLVFSMGAAIWVVLYVNGGTPHVLFGLPLGFFISGIFAGSGAYLAELFPSGLRSSGAGFCYSVGRAFAAGGPALLEMLQAGKPLSQFGTSIAVVAGGAYLLAALSALSLPETRGRALTGG